MRVLIAVASKHGATAEIAKAIGVEVTEAGHEVTIDEADPHVGIAGFDAVIVGSAVYGGQWRKPARRFVAAHEQDLEVVPVWIFSSGPIGDPPMPEDDPVDISEIRDRVTVRAHVTFAGKLDRDELGFGEKAIVAALHSPEGDFRDWNEIRAFGRRIAAELDAMAEV